MGRKVAFLVLALAIAWVYWYILIATVGYVGALPVANHWQTFFSTRHSAVLTWMVMWHTLAVLVVSAPFGLLIHRIYGRRGLVVALLTTLVMFSLEMPHLGDLFCGRPLRLQIVAAFDQLKLIAVLPLAVWVFSKLLPSNNR